MAKIPAGVFRVGQATAYYTLPPARGDENSF